ncbi:YihY/virulence factor BrkB family protein, partial [Streptomyces anulatus]
PAAVLFASTRPPASPAPDDDDDEDGGPAYMPSEFPERWSRFLPPDDVKSRLHATWEKEPRDPKESKDVKEPGETTGPGASGPAEEPHSR